MKVKVEYTTEKECVVLYQVASPPNDTTSVREVLMNMTHSDDVVIQPKAMLLVIMVKP